MDNESSEVSVDGNLRGDLEDALQGDFDFKGSYHYAGTFPAAPNPCLNISGLGLVRLPLGPQDDQAIIHYSARVPVGRGERTLVDTNVRDTWDIEPVEVKFESPAWANFIRSTVVTMVCEALGVTLSSVLPRYELYKLLLYEPGSQIVPFSTTLY